MDKLPEMYTQLASWWPLISPPEDYAEEAALYHQILLEYAVYPPKSLLELGCGGGNNASYLKKNYSMTLVDLSHGMLDVSRKLNPECIHVLGDMRTVRLETEYNAVLIHDAIMYMTDVHD